MGAEGPDFGESERKSESVVPASARPVSRRLTVALGLGGVAISGILFATADHVRGQIPALYSGPFIGSMLLMFLSGFIPRVLRRKIFFGEQLTLHRAFSFESLLQGAVLMNPPLPYPGVERELLARESPASRDRIALWFRVRLVCAVIIPLGLAAAAACIYGWWWWSGSIMLLGLLALLLEVRKPLWQEKQVGQFVAAVLLGLLAALTEGYFFTQASLHVRPTAHPGACFVLYAMILTAFELSPVPFALGVLEIVYVLMAAFPGAGLPGIILPFSYRLWRGVPVLILTYFYAPRYKLSIRDLFDPLLPLALSQRDDAAHGSTGAQPRQPSSLSIIIPAYNEAERLPRYLPDVIRFCGALPGRTEILVVDDGSRDGTADYVREMAAGSPLVRLISFEMNRGKGAAVRHGVLEAAGDYILFADADGATPITEAGRLLQSAERGAEVVIASRGIDNRDVERTVMRRFFGAVFCRLTNLLALPGIMDTQCGFKLFRRSVARRLFSQMIEEGWAFDVEVLFLAQKFGFSIVEVPVRWREVEGSKIRPLRDAIRILVAVLRIRRRDAGLMRVWRGREARL